MPRSFTSEQKAARTEYMREWRKRQSAEQKERKRKTMKARSKAMTRLTGLHPEDFKALLEDELAREGLTDVDVRGRRKDS